MKELVILRGLPGSGKSTLAHLLTTGRASTKIIENDQYMYENGVYVWKASKLKGAVRYTTETLVKALREEIELIVISNVNARPSDFSEYMKMGKEKGYKVTVVVVENRNDTVSRHGVSKEKINNMKENFDISL